MHLKKTGSVVAIFAVSALVLGAGGCDTQETDKQASQEQAKPVYVFNVPSLVGKNIDEVRSALGKPADSAAEPSQAQLAGTSEWDNTFKKDSKELLVTFNPKSREVIDFFLEGSDKDTLLGVGNLKSNSSDYRVEEVKALTDPSAITGIKVVPN